MDNQHDAEFHRMLEPDVTIQGAESDDDDMDAQRSSFMTDGLPQQIDGNTPQVKPDISIIPVNDKKPRLKLRLFKKEYSPSKDDGKKVRSRSPRTQVRLVTKEEIDRTVDTYQRRKSLPLEKCPICKKYFRRMKTHLLKHEQYQQQQQQQQQLQHQQQQQSVNNLNDSLTCSYCMKTFNTQSNLLIHMRTHTGDKPYVCDICQKGFAQSCNLVNHMRIHTGERPFKCPHCERAFTQSGNLNNHIRLHTDEKPFKCHFCDKAFVQSGNLNSHIKNNHKFLNDYDNQPLDGYKC